LAQPGTQLQKHLMISHKIILSYITCVWKLESFQHTSTIPYDLSYNYRELITKSDLRTSELYRKFVLRHIISHCHILSLL